MSFVGFVPVTGASLRQPCDRRLHIARPASAPTHSRYRRRSHILAVAQVSGESPASSVSDVTTDDTSEAAEEAPKRFTTITNVYETPGGWIVDAIVTNFNKETKHTVILGKNIMEDLCEGLEGRSSPGQVVEYVFDYFMSKGQNLTNTEGLLDVGCFPINYFGVRQVFYFFPDAKEVLIARITEALGES